MPIDRAATLRNAEKLLRQGKPDQAIAEYVRLVDDQPRDWNTANTLGDLYVRARQIDKAVEQFIRIADHLYEEGFFPKAGALYKKVLKIKPDQEHAMLQSAEVAAGQGLLVEARQAFNGVADLRRNRRDTRGLAQIRIRLGSVDPEDYEARIDAARARAELGDSASALSELKVLAAELADKGREADAIEVIHEAAEIDPDDGELREQLLLIYISAGDFENARACAATIDQLKALATALEERGYPEHALAALVDASHLDPADAALKGQLARAFVAQGDLESAAQFLTTEIAGSDVELRLTLAGIRLRAGEVDEGVGLLKQLLEEDPSHREAVAVLGWNLAEQEPEAGYPAVALAADAAIEQSDWAGGAATLQEFVTRVPNHIPALMRLVEVCVDGGLEATMFSAQAHLADAYIAVGAAAEARFIAEDLVAREPWERANVERFRQALVLLGEPDPDGVIADRLSGQSPFTTTDLSIREITEEDERPTFTAPQIPPVRELQVPPVQELQVPPVRELQVPPVRELQAPVPELQVPPAPARTAANTRPPERAESDLFELSGSAIDLESVLGEFRQPSRTETRAEPQDDAEDAAPDFGEIDLSVALDEATRGAASPSKIEADELEGVFEQLRGETPQRLGDVAAAQYERALALREVGEIDDAIEALQSAARSPRLRFQAATLLGRIYRDRDAFPQAIEWFERAAEAAAPSATEARLLLYELADALESGGEVARALAICLELRADAGEFKDLSARINRLAKVQTRG